MTVAYLITQHLYETLYNQDLTYIIMGRVPNGYYLRLVKTYDQANILWDNLTKPTKTLMPLRKVLAALGLTIPAVMLTALQQERHTYRPQAWYYPPLGEPYSLAKEP